MLYTIKAVVGAVILLTIIGLGWALKNANETIASQKTEIKTITTDNGTLKEANDKLQKANDKMVADADINKQENDTALNNLKLDKEKAEADKANLQTALDQIYVRSPRTKAWAEEELPPEIEAKIRETFGEKK